MDERQLKHDLRETMTYLRCVKMGVEEGEYSREELVKELGEIIKNIERSLKKML